VRTSTSCRLAVVLLAVALVASGCVGEPVSDRRTPPAAIGPAATGSTETGSGGDEPAAAGSTVRWLCAPGRKADPCSGPLRTTVRERGARARVVTPARPRPARRPVDCFYVYPTVSNQFLPNATPTAAPEVVSIARYQAARFSSVCRVFAPLYRQVTVLGGLTPERSAEVAYRGVVAAWRAYRARRDTATRGVVLIGHSQGAVMLRRLVRAEIDPRPRERRRLVSALLLGGNVRVAPRSTAGGDFRSVPLCGRAGQTGCVVAYSTFAEEPPPGASFGAAASDPTTPLLGYRPPAGSEVACTRPGRLLGAPRTPLALTVPTERFAAGGVRVAYEASYPGARPTAATPWVAAPDRYAARCQRANGAHVLRLRPLDGSRPLRQLDPRVGTHTLDVNAGLDVLVAVVRRQARAYVAR